MTLEKLFPRDGSRVGVSEQDSVQGDADRGIGFLPSRDSRRSEIGVRTRHMSAAN